MPGQLLGMVPFIDQDQVPVPVLRLPLYRLLVPQGPLSAKVNNAVLALPVVLETLPAQPMVSPGLKDVLPVPLPLVVKAETTATLPPTE